MDSKISGISIYQYIHIYIYIYTSLLIPIGSMYGIYSNIWGILMVNVTIYGIHRSYGIEKEGVAPRTIPLLVQRQSGRNRPGPKLGKLHLKRGCPITMFDNQMVILLNIPFSIH